MLAKHTALLKSGIVTLLLLLNFSTASLAQEGGVGPGETLTTNPKSRSAVVSASMPDLGGPTTPILIKPPNNSFVTTSKPTFVWKGATDPKGIDSYTITLDGNVLFSDIPIYSVDTNLYTLVYDPDTHYYSLTPKISIDDGTHTWKITAYDTQDNHTSSVTWSFTIDTTAPYIIIQTIDTQQTSISSQDLSTIPTQPLPISSTNPVLTGIGEPNATVTLTVTFSNNQTPQTYTFVINPDGTWTVQLTNLPRDIVSYLSFVIIDSVGNIATLDDVPLIVSSTVVPSTQPGATPLLPPPGTPETPLPSSGPGITPGVPSSPLPYIQDFTRGFLERVRQVPSGFSFDLFLVLLLLLLVTLLKFAALLSPLGNRVSFVALQNAFRLWFYIPFASKTKRGVVFDHESGVGVPYAPIHSTLHNGNHIWQEQTFFTDEKGLFYNLPESGLYSFAVDQPQYLFPSPYPRPKDINYLELYKGETIEFTREQYKSVLIPVTSFTDAQVGGRELTLRYTHLLVKTSSHAYLLTCFALTLLFPNMVNLATTLVYLLFYGCKRLERSRHTHEGKVFSTDKNPIQHALVKIKLPKDDHLIDFDISTMRGEFRVEIPVDSYSIESYKLGWEYIHSSLPVVLMQKTTPTS